MKPDLAPNPVAIRLLRANGIMPQAQDLAHLLQQLELGVGYNRIEPDALRLPGRKTDFFGVSGRLSLTLCFSGVGMACEEAPQPLQRFAVVDKPLKRF